MGFQPVVILVPDGLKAHLTSVDGLKSPLYKSVLG
jgi:hypothetical protein